MVCPVIDVIDWNTFEYLGNSGEPQIGGFDWRLVFTWHVVPQRERESMRSPIDVIRSAFLAPHLRAHPTGGMDDWLSTSIPCLLLPQSIYVIICCTSRFYIGMLQLID